MTVTDFITPENALLQIFLLLLAVTGALLFVYGINRIRFYRQAYLNEIEMVDEAITLKESEDMNFDISESQEAKLTSTNDSDIVQVQEHIDD